MDTITLPVLSVELFQLIIDDIATHPPSVHQSFTAKYSRLGTLTRCALVCKRFAHMCRPHIFEHIHTVGLAGEAKARLLCLVKNSMTGEPSLGLLQLVRMLTFDASSSSWYGLGNDSLEDSQLPLVIETLSSFPKLRYLDIYRVGVGFSSQHNVLHPIYTDLVQGYLKQGTLQTLCLDELPQTISPGAILSSPLLSHLSLAHLNAANLITLDRGVASNITELKIASCRGDHFSLAFLDHCPRLEVIGFYHVQSLIPSPPHSDSKHVFDPSKLKDLSPADLPSFVRFCELRAPHNHRKIFQDLEVLNVSLKQTYISSLCDMLKATASLHRLSIYVMQRLDPFYLTTLELGERFQDQMLASLTHIRLIMKPLRAPQGYEMSLTDIHSVFLAASHRNSIQDIFMQLTIDARTVDVVPLVDRPSHFLNPLATTLACGVGYPSLKEVNFSICFESLKQRGSNKSTAVEQGSLRTILKRGMKAMAERDGVRYVENVIYPPFV